MAEATRSAYEGADCPTCGEAERIFEVTGSWAHERWHVHLHHFSKTRLPDGRPAPAMIHVYPLLGVVSHDWAEDIDGEYTVSEDGVPALVARCWEWCDRMNAQLEKEMT